MRPGTGRGGGVSVKLIMGGAGGHPPSPWRTPTPYMFLGLAFTMLVIAVSLLVLICTRRKQAPSSSSSANEKAPPAAGAIVPLDREPKVVVFMPGDHDAPSFLASAKPLAVGAAAVV